MIFMMLSMENGRKQLKSQQISLKREVFVDLDQEIEDLMLATTDKWLAGEEVPEDAILENFVKYHHLVRDFDKREADGIKPVLPLLKEFQELETFADLQLD